RVTLLSLASLALMLSCDEKLPTGPDTFTAQLAFLIPHDTLVVGDSSLARAQTTDATGRQILSLVYGWTSADTTILGLAASNVRGDTTRRLVGRRTGRSLVTLALADARFVVSPVTRTQTVVVDGVGLVTSRDTTLTAINDTAVVMASGFVHFNGVRVRKASQGIRWIHLGLHVAVIGQGDTIRVIARTNGPDTLIATHDFCLASAKCADTAVVRVTQKVTFSLSARSFLAWSFGDTAAPTVTLADSRGNGLAGATVRFVPATPADAAIVRVTPPLGMTNPATGLMAAPALIAIGNGTAVVTVQGIGADGFSVVASESITDVVRQVARRVAVEPQRALLTANDSLPIRPLARDARGVPIADATISTVASVITLNGIWAGPTPFVGSSIQGSITPTLTGVALPESNPLAPQVPVTIDQALISLIQMDTATAGSTARTINAIVLDSLGQPATGQFVRFGTSFGPVPDSAQVQATGVATATWTPPDSAGFYTLTGIRGTTAPFTSVADSAGRVVVRRSITVVPALPSALMSKVTITDTILVNTTGTAVLTITVKDAFGNIVKTATPASFGLTAAGSAGAAFGPVSCTAGICTVTYTAGAASAAATISVQIGGVDVLYLTVHTPIRLTIT
ncbi:MAG TPA: hypothetical protein VHE78_19630, partial [Gemmatimonadaceae bacterium]|nr:hypothetical protein [Gemmatimonadaceae bacterium]